VKKILFICPYPVGLAPSQRFRFEQYLRHLNEKGFQTVIKPFFSENTYRTLYQNRNLLLKIYGITESYFNRLLLLFHMHSFSFVFIHREATPLGPPLMEWIIAKVFRKKLIYDFDDAICLTDKNKESRLARWLRCRSKVASVCKWSYKISCGNDYLAQYARHFNSSVMINPTTIDTENLHVPIRKNHNNQHVTIGWTGSHSTLKYLETIIGVLQLLEQRYPQVEFLVIADRDPALPLQRYQFAKWSRETEITDLASADIGVMPMPDDDWTRGKCGFKALQYMAMQIPAVISPVGVNKQIVENGVEGFLCDSSDDWFRALEYLVLNPEKRMEMGAKGRQKVLRSYSVASNSANFLSLFQ
jgi:glycosyltransferase involved in cell wall biosynthesis